MFLPIHNLFWSETLSISSVLNPTNPEVQGGKGHISPPKGRNTSRCWDMTWPVSHNFWSKSKKESAIFYQLLLFFLCPKTCDLKDKAELGSADELWMAEARLGQQQLPAGLRVAKAC